MNLKFKYLLFIGVIHTLLVLLVYQLLKEDKWLFIISEILLIVSLYFSYRLFKSFIKPLDLLHSGTTAIADADFSIKYLKTGSKEVDSLINVFNKMIDSLREERTRMSEQSYFIQNLIQVTPLGIIIMNLDQQISTMNPAARTIFNLNHLSDFQKLPKEKKKLFQSILDLKPGSSEILTTNGLNKYKCQVEEVIHQGFKRKFLLIDDLSSELLQTEKEAFGRIIRIMAHEVNNSIGAINSIIDTVTEFGLKADKPAMKESLILAKNRNLSLSQFMANYAAILRLPEPRMVKLDLNNLLKKCGQLYIPKAASKQIKIEFKLTKQPVSIIGDMILLEQAISNILKNAMEAIHSSGQITIRSTDNPICFSITDNGIGISKANENQLFTPFFSTKVNGQGVGLMLIRDILEKHDTDFELKTDSNSKLTTFQVRFK